MDMIENVKNKNAKEEEELNSYAMFKRLLPTLVWIVLFTFILALIARYVEFKFGF